MGDARVMWCSSWALTLLISVCVTQRYSDIPFLSFSIFSFLLHRGLSITNLGVFSSHIPFDIVVPEVYHCTRSIWRGSMAFSMGSSHLCIFDEEFELKFGSDLNWHLKSRAVTMTVLNGTVTIMAMIVGIRLRKDASAMLLSWHQTMAISFPDQILAALIFLAVNSFDIFIVPHLHLRDGYSSRLAGMASKL
ncbi:hypothetical protein BDY21DRAFT_196475 [Lineolata rhizophorae]|uniref:Integral membrane protein n=1 Tax=Lineolata rhizophorae TaxID=578093 RepID=A0A6A6P4F4_9PEZI|nr:hypothetical protein BDY21DRAFT_196475 [Lineolata rhizophorae]